MGAAAPDEGHAPSGPAEAPGGLRPPPARRRVPPWLHVAAFVSLLAVWTWKLLEPAPVPERLRLALDLAGLAFLAAKFLHLTGYAVLTALGGSLVPGRRWRWAVVVFLALHGVGTEIGQTYVPNRTGRVRDVVIDWAGIALGAWALQRWVK